MMTDAPEETKVIDLDAEAFRQICEAAAKSPWIPLDYMQNDWISDVCAFLSSPRALAADLARVTAERDALAADNQRREAERKLMSARIAAQRKECRWMLAWSNATHQTFQKCVAERQGLFQQIAAERARVERLRGALLIYADDSKWSAPTDGKAYVEHEGAYYQGSIARAALTEETPDEV